MKRYRSTSTRWLIALLALVLAAAGAGTASASADGGARASVVLSASQMTITPKVNTECFYANPCNSSDKRVEFGVVSNGDTSGCTFSLTTTWGDGKRATKDVPGGADGALLAVFAHEYTTPDPFIKPHTYDLAFTSVVTSGADCVNSSGALQFIRTCDGNELSGTSWNAKFPGDSSTADLADPFRTDALNFIAAMQAAGITVNVLSTLRSVQRAYLFHYAYLIAKGQISADQVPAFTPAAGQASVDICWEHTDANGAFDSAASVTAATRLAHALHISLTNTVAPALQSVHTRGEAIDMTTTWSAPSITIMDADGNPVTIDTTPQNGLNAQLIAVGATYGVIHFARNPAADANHWSINGH